METLVQLQLQVLLQALLCVILNNLKQRVSVQKSNKCTHFFLLFFSRISFLAWTVYIRQLPSPWNFTYFLNNQIHHPRKNNNYIQFKAKPNVIYMNKRNTSLYHPCIQLNHFQSKSKISLKLFLAIMISQGNERLFFNGLL